MIENNGEFQELPRGWEWKRIGEVTQPIEKVKPEEKPDDEFIYLDISSIDNRKNTITEPKIYLGKDAPSRARQLVYSGDVLFSTVRTYLKNVAVVPERYDGQIASTGFSVLRAHERVLPGYLFYYSISSEFLSTLAELQRGTSYPAVRDQDVRAQPIPIPPLSEQQRIVAKIEELFSQLDAGVAALQQAKAQLQRYRQAVLKAAVTGELTKAWREAHKDEIEPASVLLERILKERRAKWEDRCSVDMEGLPQLPDSWIWTKLEELIVEGPQNGLYLPQSAYGGGTPIIRIDDFQNNWSRSSKELRLVEVSKSQMEKYSLHPNDLVINRVNSPSHLGKCLRVSERNLPAIYESNMMRLKISSMLEASYVEKYLHSYIGRSRLTKNAKWAVNQASINQKDVKSTAVPLPSLEEQNEIVAEVDRCLSIIQETERNVDLSLMMALHLRQSILSKAFDGKLVGDSPAIQSDQNIFEQLELVNGQ